MSARPNGSNFTSSKSSIFFSSRLKADSPYQYRRNELPRAIPEFYSQDVESKVSFFHL